MSIFKDYANFYDLIYKDKLYKQEAEFVYNWANKPKNILSLGCGTGQHEKYWCKYTKIIAIDQSEEMIKNAYRHRNIKYICENINKFLFHKHLPFIECVVAMFNVVGYCLLKDIMPLLSLEKGKYFIFDFWDASKFNKQPPQPKVKYFDHSYRISLPAQITKRLIRIDFIIVKRGEIKAFERHWVQRYFHKDIQDLCKKYGYKIVGIKPTKSWTVWYKIQRR